MSADRRKARRRRTPEEVYRHIEENDMDPSSAMRILRNELPWKEWLVVDFLRYWYAIGVMVLIVFLVLGLAMEYRVSDFLGVLELFLLGVMIAFLGILGYRKLWPEGGLTHDQTVRKRARGILPRKKRRRFE